MTRILLGLFVLLLFLKFLINRAFHSLLGGAQGRTLVSNQGWGEHLEEIAYDTPIPQLERLGTANAWRYMWELVPEQSRVLDIGCSTGYLGYWLIQTRGCTVDGVEANEADLVATRKRLHRVYAADVEQPGWEAQIPDQYDVILMMDVIEHLRCPDRVLRAVRPLLSPNGIVIINVPNVANWRVRFELLRGRWDYRVTGLLDRTHVYFYTQQTLKQLIVNNGFVVDTILPTVPADNLLGFNLGSSQSRKRLLNLSLESLPGLLAYQFLVRAHLQS